MINNQWILDIKTNVKRELKCEFQQASGLVKLLREYREFRIPECRIYWKRRTIHVRFHFGDEPPFPTRLFLSWFANLRLFER